MMTRHMPHTAETPPQRFFIRERICSRHERCATYIRSCIRARTRTRIHMSGVGIFTILMLLLCALGFRICHWRELLVSCVVCCACLAQAPLTARRHKAVQAVLRCPHTATVDDTITVTIIVANSGMRSSSMLQAMLPVGGHNIMVKIPTIAAHSDIQLAVPVPARARGNIEVGPLLIRQDDVFTVLWKEYPISDSTKIFIHPVTVRVDSAWDLASSMMQGATDSNEAVKDVDFHGLREYEPGDDLRHVHWISTAKTGQVMIRQYDASLQVEPLFVLCTSTASYASAEEFETAVSVYASYGLDALRVRHTARAVCTDQADHWRTWTDARSLLNNASCIQADQDETLESHADTVRGLLHNDDFTSYVVILGTNHTDAMLHDLVMHASRSDSMVIIRIHTDTQPSMCRLAQGRLITIGSLQDLPRLHKEFP